ncbi:8069_t:CDS:2 [Entrophospora sp. SA101]|nr:8069_t:CDS:2 [Entrophospora sp. SA101]
MSWANLKPFASLSIRNGANRYDEKMVANEKQRKRFGDIKSIVNESKGSSAANKNLKI